MNSRNPNEYRGSKRIADLLTKQIKLDPIEFLGEQSFEYIVQKNDTLSKLATRHLKEELKFYALAKYNNISNPSKIQEGDEIRIPGKVEKGDEISIPGVREVAAPKPSPAGPKLTILTPPWLCKKENHAVARSDKVEISGFYHARSGVRRIFVNGRQINFDEEGHFLHSVSLTEKETPLELYAVDRRGRESKRCVTRVRTEPARYPKRPPKRPGNYYALVIGNSDYIEWPDLKAPVDDAKAVARLLRDRYGFQLIPPLFDGTRGQILIDATRDEIIDTLDKVRSKLTSNDHLLIYYAGHGDIDDDSGKAYWVPVNGKKHRGQWIALDYLFREILESMTIKHILVVSDSCFAGAVARTPPKLPPPGEKREEKLRQILQKRSRTVLVAAEGAKETPDHLGGRHSPFAEAFMDVLSRQRDPLLGEELFHYLRQDMKEIKTMLGLRPGYKAIGGTGHEAGVDFIFVPQRPSTL